MFWIILLPFLPFSIPKYNEAKFIRLNYKWYNFTTLLLAILLEPLAMSILLYTKVLDDKPAYDIIHSLLPYTPNYFTYYCDPMVFAAMLYLLYIIYKNEDDWRYIIFTVCGSLLLLRNFTIVLTSLPWTQYSYDDQKCKNLIGADYLTILAKSWQYVFCGDFLFSGHTVFYTITLIVMLERSVYIWPKIASCIIYLTCVIGLIVSRAHYTDDVIIAALLTIFTFKYVVKDL